MNTSKWSSAFHPWRKYEPGEVREITIDDFLRENPDYESTYTFQFNYIKDKGWNRMKVEELGDTYRWVSPCGNYKFFRISEAYRCQRYFEEIDK